MTALDSLVLPLSIGCHAFVSITLDTVLQSYIQQSAWLLFFVVVVVVVVVTVPFVIA